MQKILIIGGFLLIIIGLLWPWIQRIGFTPLPGDILIKKSNFTFYFPLTTGIVISLVVTILIWLFSKLG